MNLRGFFSDGMAYVPLVVGGRAFAAILDTGYSGHILLPAWSIEELGLPHLFKTAFMTADGETHAGQVHRGEVEWFGEKRSVPVDSTNGDFALVGMKMLRRLSLTLEPDKELLLLSSAA